MPAIVLAAALPLLVAIRSRREPRPMGERSKAGALLRGFIIALPALVLPFLIRAAAV